MRPTVLVAALLALTAPASAQVIRADYEHTRSEFGGEPMLVEAGSHFFADDGRYRHDRLEVASGELISEIRLPRTRERIGGCRCTAASVVATGVFAASGVERLTSRRTGNSR